MPYSTYEQFAALYPDVSEADYNRLAYRADRELDIHTAGIDNVRKLKAAFPEDDDSAEAIRRCEMELVSLMKQIEDAEQAATAAAAYTKRADGTYALSALASVSSGSESMSFASSSAAPKTTITEAASDSAAREKLYGEKIRYYLSGVTDANGVNLLYMGAYPYCIETL